MEKSTIKKISLLIPLFLYQIFTIAQAPEKFTYQAVVRDATNLLLVNQPIGLQISILRGAVPIYVETFTPNPVTNSNALVSVEVGTGTWSTGPFSAIDWSVGTLFIKADIDPSGGTAYSITGTAELLSMPYAFYAKKAENGFSGDYNDLTNKPVFGPETKITAGAKVTVSGTGESGNPYTISAIVPVSGFEHYIGEQKDGGVVFYIYADGDGLEHDLIVNLNESSLIALQTPTYGTAATSFYDGAFNTIQYVPADSPARTYVDGLGSDWYIPAIDELSLLWQNRFHIDNALESISGSSRLRTDEYYWSSTDFITSGRGWYLNFLTGQIDNGNSKADPKVVRAIKHSYALIGSPLGGGKVAYIFRPGDPGYIAGQVHGLIVSNSDLSTAAPWGCSGTSITGADGIILGTGAQNTIDIEAGCFEVGTAADLCAAYVNTETGSGVYSDWYLPSLNEISKVYLNRASIGGFLAPEYWSSTEGTSTDARVLSFATGAAANTPKTNSIGVRAVRPF